MRNNNCPFIWRCKEEFLFVPTAARPLIDHMLIFMVALETSIKERLILGIFSDSNDFPCMSLRHMFVPDEP